MKDFSLINKAVLIRYSALFFSGILLCNEKTFQLKSGILLCFDLDPFQVMLVGISVEALIVRQLKEEGRNEELTDAGGKLLNWGVIIICRHHLVALFRASKQLFGIYFKKN